MIFRAIALISAIALSGNAMAQDFSGADLRSELQLWSHVDRGTATPEQNARLGHVLGYIEGFSDAYLQEKTRGGHAAQDMFTFCLPSQYTVGELRRVAEAYLNRRQEPHIDRAPASGVLAMAFHEAYPCRKR